MPAQCSYLESAQDLASLLGPRQADIMRLLWTRGPATVRQLLTWLTEKGLLERRLATNADESARYGQAYVYAPRVSEDEFMRAAVGRQIDSLITHYPTLVQQQLASSTARWPLDAVGGDRAQIEQALADLAITSGLIVTFGAQRPGYEAWSIC